MKLVKTAKPEDGSGKCREVTTKGSRCSRKAVKQGYCNQHYKLLEERGLIVEVAGDELLEEVPPVPEVLKPTGRKHWQIYCRYLIDQGQLYQVYLLGIANLCYLEDQLVEVRKEIEEYGSVNIYENGIQRNGYASHFDKLLGHIRSLRSDYGLTLASSKSTTSSEGSAQQPQPKKGYESGRTKGY